LWTRHIGIRRNGHFPDFSLFFWLSCELVHGFVAEDHLAKGYMFLGPIQRLTGAQTAKKQAFFKTM